MTPAEVAEYQRRVPRAGRAEEAGDGAMTLSADVSVARAELVAAAIMWHGSEDWAPELHRAVQRYQTLREWWIDSLTPLPVEPP